MVDKQWSDLYHTRLDYYSKSLGEGAERRQVMRLDQDELEAVHSCM